MFFIIKPFPTIPLQFTLNLTTIITCWLELVSKHTINHMEHNSNRSADWVKRFKIVQGK